MEHTGYCHICGTYGKLSFEHIPPEGALNHGKAMVYTGDEVLKRYRGEKSKYQSQQRGMGKYTLCDNCNNKTGSWYVPAYNTFAQAVAWELQKMPALQHGNAVSFSTDKILPLQFVKQVVTMFCSLLPVSEVQRLGFDKLLLDKDSNQVDKSLFDLRIYLTQSSVGQLMVGPTAVIRKTETGFDSTWVCDLCAYPFGFILNLSPENPIEYGASLMGLFDTEYGKAYDMTWTLTYLERTSETLPMPLVFKALPSAPVSEDDPVQKA